MATRVRKSRWSNQPQNTYHLSGAARSGVVAVWKPFAGPVGAADASGFGFYSPARTSESGLYPFHGYFLNGSSELSTQTCPDGFCWSGDGSTQKGYSLAVPDLSSGDFTFVVRFLLRSTTGTQIIFGGFNVGLSPIWLYGVGLIMDGSTLRGVSANNNSSQNAEITGLETGVWYTAVLSRAGTLLRLALSSRSAITGTGAASPQWYALGWLGTGHTANSFTAACNGAISINGLWRRAFSPAEADAAARDVFGFTFARRHIFVPVSAAASTYTLGTPTYVPGSTTSTGFRPRIPVTVA